MQISFWHQDFFWTFWPRKFPSPPLGDPQWEKSNKKCFSILGIRMVQFAKRKQKNISNFLSQKNSITPAGVTSNGKKSPKFFFAFLASDWLNSRKKAKKNFDPKFGPGMCGMWPKKGLNDFPGRRVVHRLNCSTMSYLNMNFQPKLLRRSWENAEKPHFWA